MKLLPLLYEGRYNKIVGQVSKDIFKQLNLYLLANGKEHETSINLSDYEDHVAGLEFDLELTMKSTNKQRPGSYKVDGHAYTEDESVVEIEITVNPADGKKMFSKIQAELRNVIRHELEHLTQRGDNEKAGKWMQFNRKARDIIRDHPEQWYKYYLLPDEIDANLQGLQAQARSSKQPFHKVVNDFLKLLVKDGIVTLENKHKIHDAWKKRTRHLGLPPLK